VVQSCIADDHMICQNSLTFFSSLKHIAFNWCKHVAIWY